MRRRLAQILLSAFAIAVAGGAAGLLANAVSGAGIPLVAARPAAGAPVSLEQALAAHITGSATFVDSRTRVEFLAGHIAGALSIPYVTRARELDALRRELPRTRRLIVYCDGGACSSATDLSVWLAARGWRDTQVLGDGYPVWRAAGFPFSTGAAP
jgi:rhodanese-related sulfurtransferase